METIKKLTKIGNSTGIILPAGMLKDLGIDPNDDVRITSGNGFINIESAEGREVRIMKSAAKFIKKYNHDFKKLAE